MTAPVDIAAPAPGMERRRLWLVTRTDKAVLVCPTPYRGDADRLGTWLPLSQISEIACTPVRNDAFGALPGIAVYLGAIITFDAPGWLLAKKMVGPDVPDLIENACPDCGGRYLDSWHWCPPCTEERIKREAARREAELAKGNRQQRRADAARARRRK